MKEINLALLGFGTVGSGVAVTIRENSRIIEEQLGCKLVIKHVLVRNINKYKNNNLLKGIHLTDSFNDIIEDQSLDIIIEVMGGISPAKEYIFSALKKHISVVSANKDLVSLHGPEIIHMAIEKLHFLYCLCPYSKFHLKQLYLSIIHDACILIFAKKYLLHFHKLEPLKCSP